MALGMVKKAVQQWGRGNWELKSAGSCGRYRIEKKVPRKKGPSQIKTWFIFYDKSVLEIVRKHILLCLFLSALGRLLLPDLRTQAISVLE